MFTSRLNPFALTALVVLLLTGVTATTARSATPEEIKKQQDQIRERSKETEDKAQSDKQAREHKLADGAAVRAFAGHNDWVYSVAFHPGSKRVVTGSWDGELRIWNAEDAKGMLTFTAAPGLPAVAAAK